MKSILFIRRFTFQTKYNQGLKDCQSKNIGKPGDRISKRMMEWWGKKKAEYKQTGYSLAAGR
jgi:hypothetical protein